MQSRLDLDTLCALPDSEPVLARLFEVSNEPMTVTELETNRLVSVNTAFARLTGFSRDELVGRRAVDVGLWVEPKMRERYVQRLRAERRVDDFATVFRSKRGQLLPLEVSATLFEQDGVDRK